MDHSLSNPPQEIIDAFLESETVLYCSLRHSGEIAWLSPAWSRVCHCEPQALIGTPLVKLLTEEDQPLWQKAFEQPSMSEVIQVSLNHHSPATRLQWQCTLQDRHFRHFIVKPLMGSAQGRLDLEREIDHLRAAMEHSHEGVLLVSPDNQLLYANQRFFRLFGIEKSLFETDQNAAPLLKEAANRTLDARHFQTLHEQWLGNPHQDEYATLLKLRDGRTLERYSSPMLDAQNKHWGRITFYRDISAQKSAEQALRDSEERFRSIALNIPGIVFQWTINPDQKQGFSYISPRSFDLFGLRAIDLVKDWHNLGLSHEDQQIWLETLRENAGRQEPWTFTGPIFNQKGESRWIQATAQSHLSNHGDIIFNGVIMDIHEQHLGEQALQQSELQAKSQLQEINTIYSTSPVGLCTLDRDLRFIRINDMLAAQNSLRVEDHIGRHFSEVRPDLADILTPFLMRVIRTACPIINVEMQGGQEYGTWLTNFHPICNEQGEVHRISISVQDISELKQTQHDLQRHRDHLQDLVSEQVRDLVTAKQIAERASRIKSEFLANVSHELRTPMHAILGFAQLGIDHSEDEQGQRLQRYFRRIRESGDRLLTLLNDLLDLSKLESGQMKYEFRNHDLPMILHEATHPLEPLLHQKGLQLVCRYDNDYVPPKLNVDDNKLIQVLVNLLSNAIKFSSRDTQIFIDIHPDQLIRDSGIMEAISIAVSDSGIGIPEDELESVFDKFVQSSKTKTGAGGTGLGLAICREIIQAHDGEIIARNNASGGATFTITLPLRHAGVLMAQ